MRSALCKLTLTLILLQIATSINLAQLFGLTPLLQDLAKLTPAPEGLSITPYMMDPSIHTFLKQYKTRTQFCNYKCQNLFNLPCFLLFDCNIQIRDFVLLIVVPVFMISISGLCCGKGIWTFSCWLKYLATLTGVRFLVAAVRKCIGSGCEQRQRDNKQSNKQNNNNRNQLQIQPQTTQRLKTRQSASSSSSQQS